jgi:hypothetical protein
MKSVLGAAVALIAFGLGGPAFAAGCSEANVTRTPGGGAEPSSVSFKSDTTYMTAIYWADFNGALQLYKELPAYETYTVDSYVGHNWYIEVWANDGPSCLGPFNSQAEGGCSISIGYNDVGRRIEYSGYGCNF